MAVVAKTRAAHLENRYLAVLDAGEDAGLALAAMRSGADRVRFCGDAEKAVKLAEIAAQMGVAFESSSAIKV